MGSVKPVSRVWTKWIDEPREGSRLRKEKESMEKKASVQLREGGLGPPKPCHLPRHLPYCRDDRISAARTGDENLKTVVAYGFQRAADLTDGMRNLLNKYGDEF
jgi:hypothetical protein